MGFSTSIPTLGVDTGVWLTSRIDHSGTRQFYVGASTTNQRLNLPSHDLKFDDLNLSRAPLRISLDTQLVSGLSAKDSAARFVDHIYAMSRCSVNAAVVGVDNSALRTPLYCNRNLATEASAVNIRVQLEVETISDLLIRWNEFATEDETKVARNFPLSSGDQLMVAIGNETSILALESICPSGAFECTIYGSNNSSEVKRGELYMPTLSDPARIGRIELVHGQDRQGLAREPIRATLQVTD